MRRRSTLPSLPTEIWEQIFDFLWTFQLSQVRLVCKKWNHIVRDSSQLIGKLQLTIPADCTVQQLQQVATSRYRAVKVRSITGQTWFALSLAGVTKFTLENPWLSARELIEMLSSMPQLKQLHLVPDVNFDYELYGPMAMGSGWVLNQLESLHLNIGEKDEFLCIFQRICPNLEALEVEVTMKKYLGTSYGFKLLEFIRSTSSTLKEVVFISIDFRKESLLRDIMAVEGLELTKLDLQSCKVHRSDIAQICHSQLEIRSLQISENIIISHDVLTAIAMLLTNLTSLKLTTEVIDLQPILLNLPHLEKLSLNYSGSTNENLDLSAYTNYNLRVLELHRFRTTSASMLEFFRKSPNISQLDVNCLSISVRDTLVITGQLANLRELVYLSTSKPSNPDHFAEYAFTPFRRLRRLTLANSNLCCQVLSSLLEKCPLLVKLRLLFAYDIDMESPIMFMKNLTSLSLVCMKNITVQTVQRVLQQCNKLEFLFLFGTNVAEFVPERTSVKVVFE